jgi:hypothetical protein
MPKLMPKNWWAIFGLKIREMWRIGGEMGEGKVCRNGNGYAEMGGWKGTRVSGRF